MRKKILLIFSISFISLYTYAQGSISPIETNEFCPNANITFTVTLPKIKANTQPSVASWTNTPMVVSGVSNLTSSSTQTTFTFVGRFRDVNIKQEFRIAYVTDDYPNGLTYIPTFKYIKSLFYNNPTSYSPTGPCQPIGLNQTNINSPLCQITNTSISFNNIKWSTYGEGNDFCWGTITTYEYLLPAGWSIGSITSDGSTWILEDNSVTITSDLTTGDGMYILVRPSNSCASGLSNGNTPRQIYISRPMPPMTITGPSTICSGNNYTYTLNGASTGSSISWVTNSYYTITGSGTSISASPASSSHSTTTVKANVTLPNCTVVVPVTLYNVNVGSPYMSFNITYYPENEEPSCYLTWGIYSFTSSVSYGQGHTGYEWGYRIQGVPGDVISPYDSPNFSLIPEQAGTYEIFVKPVNACGVGSGPWESVKTIEVYEWCPFGRQFTIASSPNPAQDELAVTTSNESTEASKMGTNENVYMQLFDFNSKQLVKQWILKNDKKHHKLNVKDVRRGKYVLQVIKGRYKQSKQVILN